MALTNIKKIMLGVYGNKIVSSKGIVNFTKYLLGSCRKAWKQNKNDFEGLVYTHFFVRTFFKRTFQIGFGKKLRTSVR